LKVVGTVVEKLEAKYPDLAALFEQAWSRLWHKSSLPRWEIFNWTILALFFPFYIFSFLPNVMDALWSFFFFVPWAILTFIMTGLWVSAVHRAHTDSDESLRIAPVKPQYVIGIRALAVLITALRMSFPYAILGLLLIDAYSPVAGVVQRWLGIFCPVMGVYVPHEGLGTRPVVNGGLAFLAAVPVTIYFLIWMVFPIVWGFFIASDQRAGGIKFLALYFLFLIIPAVAAIANIIVYAAGEGYLRLSGIIGSAWLLIAPTGAFILMYIFFRNTCVLWMRRAK
jgi:hypothetical protein